MPAQVAPHTICAPAYGKTFDFMTMSLDEIQRFDIPISFTLGAITQVHGIALWFDCNFPGCNRQVTLSTAPSDPLTHWYQVRAAHRQPVHARTHPQRSAREFAPTDTVRAAALRCAACCARRSLSAWVIR